MYILRLLEKVSCAWGIELDAHVLCLVIASWRGPVICWGVRLMRMLFTRRQPGKNKFLVATRTKYLVPSTWYEVLGTTSDRCNTHVTQLRSAASRMSLNL